MPALLSGLPNQRVSACTWVWTHVLCAPRWVCFSLLETGHKCKLMSLLWNKWQLKAGLSGALVNTLASHLWGWWFEPPNSTLCRRVIIYYIVQLRSIYRWLLSFNIISPDWTWPGSASTSSEWRLLHHQESVEAKKKLYFFKYSFTLWFNL